jgi:hypothetical protein
VRDLEQIQKGYSYKNKRRSKIMNINEKILKYSLLSGVVYFCCMSVAHFLGVKIPLLFIYYNVPSHHYQDVIISFCAFGWATFFYSASKNRSIVPPLLVAMCVVLLGLSTINASSELKSLIEGATITPYWIQTFSLGLYTIWLAVFYFKSNKTG